LKKNKWKLLILALFLGVIATKSFSRTFLKTWQMVHSCATTGDCDAALSVLGLGAEAPLSEVLTKIDRQLDTPFRIGASATPDTLFNIGSNQVEQADGSLQTSGPSNDVINVFPASTVDYQTGATTGGTIEVDTAAFALPACTVGQFRRHFYKYVSGDNKLDSTFSAEVASLGSLTNPGVLAAGLEGSSVGYLDLECTNVAGAYKTAGSGSNIIENKVGSDSRIFRFGASSDASLSNDLSPQLSADLDANGFGITQTGDGVELLIQTEENTTADASKSGDLSLYAGEKSAGTGNGGDVNIGVGESAGGNDGFINLFGDVKLHGAWGTSGDITFALPPTVTDYTMTFPPSQGTATQVLVNDGSGVLSWENQSGSGGGNLLSNPTAEGGVQNWTESGGTLSQDTVTPISGLASFSWDSNGSSQTLDSDLETIPTKLKGKQCLARFDYTYIGGSLGDINVVVHDGTDDLTTPVDLNVSDGTSSLQAQIGFLCPTSGGVQLRFTSTVADAEILLFDDAHLGTDDRLGVTSGTDGWYIDANIGGANVDLAGSNITDYAAPNNGSLDLVQNTGSAEVGIACHSTNASEPGDLTCSVGNEEPGIVFNAPYDGVYKVCTEFSHKIQSDQAESAHVTFQLVQTTNSTQTIIQEGNSRIMSRLQAGGTAGVNTISTLPHNLCGVFTLVKGKTTIRLMREQQIVSTPDNNLIESDRAGTNGQNDIHYTVVPMTDAAPQTTVTLETQGWYAGGSIQKTGANFDLGTSTVDPYDELADDGLFMVVDPKSVPVEIPCVGKESEGLNCDAGVDDTEVIGFSIDAPYAGKYMVQMNFSIESRVDTTGVARDYFRISRTQNSIKTDIDLGDVILRYSNDPISTMDYSNGQNFTLSEVFELPAGKNTFRLKYRIPVASSIVNHNLYVNTTDNFVTFNVIPVTQNFPQAVALPSSSSDLSGSAHTNLLDNPGLEEGTVGYTADGGTYSTTETTPFEGTKSATWDPSATTQTFKTNDYDVPAGWNGKACFASLQYSWDTGTSGHLEFKVQNGSDEDLIESFSITPTSSGKWYTASAAFPCPSSGTMNIELVSTDDADVIKLDKLWLGEDYRVGETNQPRITTWEDFTPTLRASSSDPTFTSSGVYRRVGDTMEFRVIFNITAAGSGTYTMDVPDGLSIANHPDLGQGFGQDNTNRVGIDLLYSSATSIVLTRQESRTAITESTLSWGSGGSIRFEGAIPILEWAGTGTTNTVTLETQGWHVDAKIGGANEGLGVVELTTYSHNANSGFTMSINTANQSASAKIPCDGGNPATGLTCDTGDEVIGAVVQVPYSGLFEACIKTSVQIGLDGGEELQNSFKIFETDPTDLTINLQESYEVERIRVQQNAGTNIVQGHSLGICANLYFASAGEKWIILKRVVSVNATSPNSNSILADESGGSSGGRNISFKMRPLTQNFPQAVALTGADDLVYVETNVTVNGLGDNSTADMIVPGVTFPPGKYIFEYGGSCRIQSSAAPTGVNGQLCVTDTSNVNLDPAGCVNTSCKGAVSSADDERQKWNDFTTPTAIKLRGQVDNNGGTITDREWGQVYLKVTKVGDATNGVFITYP
jgi:hypothetical protein